MAPQYSVISADSHVNPLPTFWREYLPARYRDAAPRLEQTDEGDFVIFEGQKTPMGLLAQLAGTKVEDYKPTGKLSEVRPGGWDPQERLKDLKWDNVDAEILFGGGPLSTADADLHLASFRAYNTWLADFCEKAPRVFVGVAYIPMEDVDRANEELRFAADRGLKGVVIPPYPPPTSGVRSGGALMAGDPTSDRSYADPEYDPFWQATVERDMPVNIHLGGRRVNLAKGKFFPAMVGSKLSMGEAIAVFVFGGILERHPELKLVSVESGVGWFPFLAQYMDDIWKRHRYWQQSELKEPPSFYMDRQVYGIFLDDKIGVQLRNVTGCRNIMWSSDYPHSETTWPNSMKLIEEHFSDVPEDEKHRIICGAAAELYGLS
jgi:predicted TIM-barrel fold metal-dependent hydrolase